jgi:predicted dehydrogenase
LVDFVYIPLPNNLHLSAIKEAADAGKPILCEKPLCLNAREAAEAAAYCAERKVPLMEAFMYRFHPQWRRAVEILYSGEIGRIESTAGVYFYTNMDAGNIRNKLGSGGGALMDIGCYCISTARLLMGGEPKRVIANIRRDPVFKTDVLSSAILDFGDGRSSIFTVGTQNFRNQKITAFGTAGSISVELPFNMYGDVPGRIFVSQGLGNRVIETKAVDQYLLEFEAFARSLIDKTPVPTPISDAIANMTVLDALFASESSGTWEDVK